MAIQTGQTSLDDLVASPFARLTALLDSIAPGAAPIDLSLGEPRALIPTFLGPTLEWHLSEFGRYPPIRGIPALRQAIAAWLGRRYPTLAGSVAPETEVLPLSGSREGLFSAIFPALARKASVTRPAVLIPNPFYQAYAAVAAASGAEPVFLDSAGAAQFLPALDAVDETLLRRTVALYLCSPSNPQGAVAGMGYLAAAIELLIRRHAFGMRMGDDTAIADVNIPDFAVDAVGRIVNPASREFGQHEESLLWSVAASHPVAKGVLTP